MFSGERVVKRVKGVKCRGRVEEEKRRSVENVEFSLCPQCPHAYDVVGVESGGQQDKCSN